MLFSISVSNQLYNMQHVVFLTVILKMYFVTFELQLILIVSKISKARNERNLLDFYFMFFVKFF